VGGGFENSWTLFQHIAAAGTKTKVETVLHDMTCLKSKLIEIAETKCAECDGIGHTRRRCPTYERLIKLTAGIRTWKTVINIARNSMTQTESKVLLGKRMRYTL
jgi:hypothetical protein